MRACEPVKSGTVDRDGVPIAYDVFGGGERTVVFVPIDSITESRAWKAQVPFLARRARVITIDPRGNGRSGRPTDPAAYGDVQPVDDTIAVLDELGITQPAVMIGVCNSVWTVVQLAALHPGRVAGIAAVAPWLPLLTPPVPHRGKHFEDDIPNPQGWQKENRHHMLREYRDYVEFFFSELLPEPHSTKQWEDMVGWALQSSGEIQITAHDGPLSVSTAEQTRSMIERVGCPVLVIHGDADRCQPAERAEILAEITGGDRLLLEGSGHLPMGREPVIVNFALREFIDRVLPPQPQLVRIRPVKHRQRRVLFLSSPIGLGHARRDMAIADALQQVAPDVQVDWLAQAPLSDWLARHGATVHPASRDLASEVGHIDSLAGDHDLHVFQALREMDEILVANFMVFAELVEQQHYDLWVGDEAWELDHFLHENPTLKAAPYAWLTDFVGMLPMAAGREADVAADYNAEMIEHVSRSPRLRDRAVFVGSHSDVVAMPFGPGLPDIRSWTEEHFDFAGYVTGFDPAEIADRDGLRAEFGYQPGEPVCTVAVGGSGTGVHLLRRAIEAYPDAERKVPGLRMVVVTGPRIDPAALPARPGVEILPFVPDLHRRLAASDLGLVQGGLTTTMELVAARRPFIYVPLRNHFEQNIHVRHRLANYRAGTCIEWVDATTDHLSDAIATSIGAEVDYLPVEAGGAERAARMLLDLL